MPQQKPSGVFAWIKTYPRLSLFSAALIARLLMAWLIGPGDHGDDDGTYLNMAEHILKGEGPWTHPMNLENVRYQSYLPPAMGYLTALCVFFFGRTFDPLRWPIILLSSLACLWLAALGERLMGKKGRIAGWIWAFYPPQLFWSTRVNPHAIATDMLIGLLLLAAKCPKPEKSWQRYVFPSLGGLLWALMTLFRGEYLLAAGILIVYLGASCRRLLEPALFALFLTLGLAPWTVRNWLIHRRFIPISTNFARMFWETYHPDYRFSGKEIPFDSATVARLEPMTEIESKQWLMNDALNYVRRNPGRALYIWAGNMVHFWRPFLTPNAVSIKQNILYVVSYLPVFALFILGVFGLPVRKEPLWAAIALIILYKWGIHSGFYMIVRFREAIMPLLMLVASSGLLRIRDPKDALVKKTTAAD
ncbi:MAG: glycosyltransferase family 39 protein [Elusimicrobia bacterium]|nr:glycosyltransferase family 39 protein [Elusimicrobiota bacterium]